MARMMSRRLALNLAFLSVIALVNAAAECYFPNGDLARLDTPCYTDGGASHCCGPNSLCLTNGLCLAVVAPFTLSRGSCTDKTWGPSCPSICDTLQTSGGAVLAHYKGSTSDSTYCCGSVAIKNGSLVCGTINNKSQEPFSIDNGTFMSGVAALASYIGTSNSSSTAGQNMRTASNNDSKVIAVGAGVGAPLGVIAIAASVWAIVERRKRKRMAPIPTTPVFSDSRMSNGAELYGYSQKSAKRLNGVSGEVHRSY